MMEIRQKLKRIEKHVKAHKVKIMIIGLGSVGNYLLDYLVSKNDSDIEIIVVGRSFEKLESDVNIVRVAAMIREQNKSQIKIESGVDLTDVDSIAKVVEKHAPDFIVNSSRAYPGLKYGSISWHNVRAYGIWTPLSIRFVKNIMEACEKAESEAIVINTSYSDAVIPWMKTAGKNYSDFENGNLNHLIPRLKFGAAQLLGVEDFWNIKVMLSTAHFHDVCVSKEGHSEGVNLPLKIYYNGEEKTIEQEKLLECCKISMPTDAKRNMMNASSNFRIIDAIINCIRTGENEIIFSPGVMGHIGGYPVMIGYKNGEIDAWIDESVFSMEEMEAVNRKSMALDGVEDVNDGVLIYTYDILNKCKNAFGVELPKFVKYEDIDETASLIIEKIIKPNTEK